MGISYASASVEETQRLAALLAPALEEGDVLLLTGDLGAGKTHFAQGLAAALGIREVPTSPTFTLMSSYEGGRLPLYHFDLYRLDDAGELDDIDYFATIEGDGVSVVEWADKFCEACPEDYLLLDFSVRSDGVREIVITPAGLRGETLLEGLAQRL
ncbi:tRNA (adenosine(37)-N6)-threonylcarbamoyltransferase complex ATPase subunit type 1 TsaE [Slackia exigua]|uniref:tRNA (adenosine(37)-N6)-threonylcarbamoyltransferase complex ATPase subunit type 1 TsaE n=1 Tax=Slackia exigua TaxID=84109 RepID=UPI0028E7175F|nr:tRNA (adenosine(37)-N6)-threonylcarbamoyltransferase complex ATPase subunit type 1 TsaE [Slackia exigua]